MVGKRIPNNLSGKSPIQPLVIRPSTTAHRPDQIKIQPKDFMDSLILPIPRNNITPISATNKPYAASVKQKPKKNGNVIATKIVGSIAL